MTCFPDCKAEDEPVNITGYEVQSCLALWLSPRLQTVAHCPVFDPVAPLFIPLLLYVLNSTFFNRLIFNVERPTTEQLSNIDLLLLHSWSHSFHFITISPQRLTKTDGTLVRVAESDHQKWSVSILSWNTHPCKKGDLKNYEAIYK